MADAPVEADTRPVALVTGARRGLGRGMVDHLLAQGWRVYGCARHALDAPPTHPAHHHAVVDVSIEDEVVRWIREVAREAGRIDALVNNAGVASMNHALLTTRATLDRVFSTNVGATFVAAREAAKYMRRRRAGRIVNLSTVAVPLHLEGEAIYAASKAAVEELTRVLARELGELGVTVNAIGPSPIRTDLIAGVPDDKIQQIVARGALKRLGELDDVLAVLDFFLSPRAGFVTGQVMYLGGFG